MSAQQPVVHRGIVKQVLSGDSVVIRGQPRGGPPPVRTVCFSNIIAPRLARRPNPNVTETTIEARPKDEPFAWEAREFVRQKLIGKEVAFTIEYNVPGNDREYGVVYLGKDTSGENITESLIAEGLVEVRARGIKMDDPNQQRLVQLEDTAKTAKIGKWSENTVEHVRDIKWTIDDPRKFVDSHHGKPVDVVIEHVRDGCTVRAFVLPTFHYVTVMMSGIKCPMFKQEEGGTKQVAEEFAEEAKYYTEVRLLQREVQIILESTSNQNLLGTILHPNGSIAEMLLKEGFARCVDWSMGVVSQGAEKLRAAEKIAKEKKVRLWKDYKPSASNIDVSDRSYTGKVVEIVNGDSLVLKVNDNAYKKIFLASIRPPRLSAENTEGSDSTKGAKRTRPLYDIPYMFEAREFLRKKLIGKKVNVQVDYIQPPNMGFPEKTCCTVTIGGINVAEALVSKGFGTVIRYRQDDDQRSSKYDELLAAEARAEKKGVGVHSKKEKPLHRVADISGDVPKAKQFLPFLQRAGRSDAVVEFVASGSRLRLFIPRETCLITFLISGIECPRGSRPMPSGGGMLPAEPYGEDALTLTKELCMQREVEVEVEAMDKGGNFIGWLYVDGTNLSVALIEEGLATVHFTAERSVHYKTLLNAEDKAKSEKKNIWSKYEEPKETTEIIEEPVERKVNLRKVVVTEVKDDLHFYAQFVDNGPKLEQLMDQIRQHMESNPPLPGSYTPKRGDLCAANFSLDQQWYRAKVEKVGANSATVLYIDYGNRETTSTSKLAPLPGNFSGLPAQAVEFALACVVVPPDPEAKQEALEAFSNDVTGQQLDLNTEYKAQGIEHVSLMFPDNEKDVAEALIADGILQAEKRKEKRLAKIVQDYNKAQEKAKGARLNLWRYGDFTEDDAAEFGYRR